MNSETTFNEIAARLTLLEFALEVLFARDMARLPMRAIADRSVELAERFVHKVSRREAELRAQ